MVQFGEQDAVPIESKAFSISNRINWINLFLLFPTIMCSVTRCSWMQKWLCLKLNCCGIMMFEEMEVYDPFKDF